jgi:UDP-hydrolysing UDP-N-acetyl-D-glucosamine 2-epimerase
MAKQHRKICVLTGTRAEYGLLKSLLQAIHAQPKLELHLAVTGMHLVKKFGYTIDDIIRDGWKIAVRIPMYSGQDRREHLAPALATLVNNLSTYLLKKRIDIVVVLGDRIEALGGALAALTAGVPLAHIHGGELAPGEMDDRIRYAITSLANLHFTATAQARARLIRLGQPPSTVHCVGAIGLDHIFALRRDLTRHDPGAKAASIKQQLGLDPHETMLLVVQHPCGYGVEGEQERMHRILQAVGAHQGIIIGPCADPGHSGILQAIREHRKSLSAGQRWRFVASLDRQSYLEALWASDVLIGNSSSGILEANALGTAVVNIGPRQTARQRNGNTIIDCSYDLRQIRRSLAKAMVAVRAGKVRASRAFGGGQTGGRMASILLKTPIDHMLLTKNYS